MQFHVLSFEGPDQYAKAGGLATRVEGLCDATAELGYETHLWFIGAPDAPAHETRGRLHLHRWGQWISAFHPGGVYDGEEQKRADYVASLPPALWRTTLAPHLAAGGRAVVIAEEWQTADAVLHLDWTLRTHGVRERVSMLWNANNTFGFERIDWGRLAQASSITTVSRYMKYLMRDMGVEAVAIPNGLAPEAFDSPDVHGVAELRSRLGDRTVLVKMARFDPDKRWLGAIQTVAEMKRQGWRPLLIARGDAAPHGREVLALARTLDLRIADRKASRVGLDATLAALTDLGDTDVVNLTSFVEPRTRQVLFRGADAVLANSSHEPFGLVGLETMAAGGIACTGASGEDYAVAGHNAIVLQTESPREFVSLYRSLQKDPSKREAMRRAGQRTAKQFAWPEVLRRNFLPHLEAVAA